MRAQTFPQLPSLLVIAVLFAGVASGVPNPEAAAELARSDSEVTIRFAITSVQYSQDGDELVVEASGFVKDTMGRRSRGLIVGDDIKIIYGVRPVEQSLDTKRDFELQRPGLPLERPTPILKVGDVGDGWFGRNDDGSLYPSAAFHSFEFIGRQELKVMAVGAVSYLTQGDSVVVDELGTYLRLVDLCDTSACEDAPRALFDVIQDGRYQRHALTRGDLEFELSAGLSLGLNDIGVQSVAVGVVPKGPWGASSGAFTAPLPQSWRDLILSPTTSYVQEMSLSGEGRIVAAEGARRLVHFLSESEPPEGSEQARSENSLIGIYSEASATWEDARIFINSSYIGRSGGCWTALTVYLFYGDVDGDGRLDIGMLPEQINCESVYDEVDEVDRPHRVHKFESLQWYLKNGGAQGDERWRMDSTYNGRCPADGLRYINPPDADGTAIEQALNHRRQLDSKDVTVPYCAERAIENGFYRPAPKLPGDLLEYDYMNFAFGFTRGGILVDQHGQVFSTSARQPLPNTLQRLAVTGPYRGMVPTIEIARIRSVLLGLDAVEVPKPEKVQCCDLGSATYLAWRHNAVLDTHEIVVLATELSTEWEHPNAAAAEIVQWLKKVRETDLSKM